MTAHAKVQDTRWTKEEKSADRSVDVEDRTHTHW